LNINVKNKRILITASSRGIGWGIAKVFLHEGAYVFMCARHLEDLRDVKENWENAYIYYCDLTDQSSLEVLINSIIKKREGLMSSFIILVIQIMSRPHSLNFRTVIGIIQLSYIY